MGSHLFPVPSRHMEYYHTPWYTWPRGEWWLSWFLWGDYERHIKGCIGHGDSTGLQQLDHVPHQVHSAKLVYDVRCLIGITLGWFGLPIRMISLQKCIIWWGIPGNGPPLPSHLGDSPDSNLDEHMTTTIYNPSFLCNISLVFLAGHRWNGQLLGMAPNTRPESRNSPSSDQCAWNWEWEGSSSLYRLRFIANRAPLSHQREI